MKSMPTVENAAARFDAKTVAHRLDVGARHAEHGVPQNERREEHDRN